MRPIQAYLKGGPKDGDFMAVQHNAVAVMEAKPLQYLRELEETPVEDLLYRTGHYRSTPVIVYEWVGWDGE